MMKKQNKRTGLNFDGTADSLSFEEDGLPHWSHKHDYPIEEVWNTHRTIAKLIVPRLRAFRTYDENGEFHRELVVWMNGKRFWTR